jgi:catechol 2,3-dioxygenase-like lactoylglutathione lyase family enzyme
MHHFISGIQQIGIGVTDAVASKFKYKNLFGMSTLVFDDSSEAALMTKYTGNEVHNRQAILSMNLQGGGGFEIWQFKSRTPSAQNASVQYGDLGIFAAKMKTHHVHAAHEYLSKNFSDIEVTPIQKDPAGHPHFWVKEQNGNWFNIVTATQWFTKNKFSIGGVTGAVIGVSNMDNALKLYRDVLGISGVVYDVTETFHDNPNKEAGKYRRVLLRKHVGGKGAFNKLLGAVEIELVECLDRKPAKLFENRYWGDCGFIHLCFDVLDMEGLQKHAEKSGFNFTVDSKGSFAMENAAGRFCYLEDPDGTLIELVETHKVPILKKLGWYMNLQKRGIHKPLPDWMIKTMGFSKVK